MDSPSDVDSPADAIEPGGPTDRLVHLDRIGEATPGWTGSPATIVTVGVPDAPRQRLSSRDDYRLLDELGAVAEADAVLVSTRLPRREITSVMRVLGETCPCPIIALVHTGGENLAVEVMRAGGTGVIGEGNEDALRAFLSGTAHDTSLVDTYDRHVGHTRSSRDPALGRDPATQLPGRSSFEQRLSDLAQSGDAPRVALLRVLGLTETDRPLSAEALDLLRRRLAMSYRQLMRGFDAELFTLTETDFAILGLTMTPNAAEQLAARLTLVTEAFAPHHATLVLAVGHAGSEVSTDPGLLTELAQRALAAATLEKQSAVVGADTLSAGLSSSTELEAATRLLEFVERHDAYPPGHGKRVAGLSAELASELGYEGLGQSRIQLAAHLHDIGKVGLPVDAMAGPEGLDGELLDAYRSHPIRGADCVRASAGDEVAQAIRCHHEHWDGSGFPDGLAGSDIPVAARIIAVADAVDGLLHRNDDTGPEERQERLQQDLAELAGRRLDPELVEIAASVFAHLSPRQSEPAPMG